MWMLPMDWKINWTPAPPTYFIGDPVGPIPEVPSSLPPLPLPQSPQPHPMATFIGPWVITGHCPKCGCPIFSKHRDDVTAPETR